MAKAQKAYKKMEKDRDVDIVYNDSAANNNSVVSEAKALDNSTKHSSSTSPEGKTEISGKDGETTPILTGFSSAVSTTTRTQHVADTTGKSYDV